MTAHEPTCRELIDFLDKYVDRELPGDVRSRFEEHLEGCSHCVDYLRGYRAAIEAARDALAAPDVVAAAPAELIEAILKSISR